MQGDRVVGISLRRLGEFVGNLRFGRTQDHPRLALSLGLRLAAHRVLQCHRNTNIADFDGFDPDPPIGGFCVYCRAQLLVGRPAVGEQPREIGGADRFTQRCLRHPGNHFLVARDLERRAPHVGDDPEDDRVNIDRHRVLGEGLLGDELSGAQAGVDQCCDIVEYRDDPEQPGAPDREKFAGPQDDCLLPLLRHLECDEHDHSQDDEHRPGYQEASRQYRERAQTGEDRSDR
jgi:hypothetical protein